KINVAELEVMVGLVEVINLGLQLLDAPPIERAGQLEAARGRGRGAIGVKVIPEGAQTWKEQDKQGPEPLPLANRMHQHPDREASDHQGHWRTEEVIPVLQAREQRTEHVAQTRAWPLDWQPGTGIVGRLNSP